MAYIALGNRKGGRVLVFNDFRYHKNRTTKRYIHWRCWRQSCNSMLTTNFFDVTAENVDIRVYKHDSHNHAVDSDMIQQEQLRHAMVAAVRQFSLLQPT